MKKLVAALGAVLSLVCVDRVASAQSLKLEWNVEGYYRTRTVTITNLAPEPRHSVSDPVSGDPVVMPDIRNTSYIIQRLRLSPTVKMGKIAALHMELNAFDDVLWGDNNGLSTAPLFAVNGTNQYYLGGKESQSINMSRAWVEFNIPVGVMRVGRMPSHWGMGLLANGGGSGNYDPLTPPGKPRRHVQDYYFDDDFGDNHFGSTNDRILFATKPLTIMKTIQKRPNTESNFIIAYAFDKLSEAPVYFAADDQHIRPFGQQGFISRGAQQDDTNEHVFVAAYSDPDWNKVRYTDELKFGTYWVLRTQDQGFTDPNAGAPDYIDAMGNCKQVKNDNPVPKDACVTKDTGSFVWIADFWYRIRYGTWYSEAEGIHIGGSSTGGIPFPSANQKKAADIDSGAFRFGYMTDKLDALFEVGYASGDEDIGNKTLKQRAMHPDYHVGLILFPEVLRERSARTFGPSFFSAANPNGAVGFFSQGGVINAKYLQPKVRWRPDFGGFEVVGAILFAWLDKWADVSPGVFPCPTLKVDMNGKCTASDYLGTEVDVALKSRFADDHLDFSLESGYLFFGDALKTASVTGLEIPNAPSGAFSLQARIAYIF